jgi:hypothetical protein
VNGAAVARKMLPHLAIQTCCAILFLPAILWMHSSNELDRHIGVMTSGDKPLYVYKSGLTSEESARADEAAAVAVAERIDQFMEVWNDLNRIDRAWLTYLPSTAPIVNCYAVIGKPWYGERGCRRLFYSYNVDQTLYAFDLSLTARNYMLVNILVLAAWFSLLWYRRAPLAPSGQPVFGHLGSPQVSLIYAALLLAFPVWIMAGADWGLKLLQLPIDDPTGLLAAVRRPLGLEWIAVMWIALSLIVVLVAIRQYAKYGWTQVPNSTSVQS